MVFAALIAKSQSVLSSGDWYKIGITETNIYKIDRDFLRDLGLPVNSLDPRTLKIYGNGGGGPLPQSNAEERPVDLAQNAVFSFGEDDGSLDNGDYFLFYGHSPHKIEWTSTGVDYERNIYSDTTYYFITFDGDQGIRIESADPVPLGSDVISTYDDVIIHETDEGNILNSGRIWFGETFSPALGTSLTFNFSRENVTSFESITVSGIAQSELECSFDISVNDVLAGNLTIDSIPFGEGSRYTDKGKSSEATFDLDGASNSIRVDFDFNPNGSTSIGYLDHMALWIKRNLVLENDVLFFRSIASTEVADPRYEISNSPSDLEIWDVSDPTSPDRIDYQSSAGTAQFSIHAESVKELVAFSGSDFPEPVNFGSLANQSIQSISGVDALIVSHPNLLSEAERLADFHERNDGLRVAVVTTQQVYNEFSSGSQDVSAIRDFAKHVYESGNLKYLLLFGDASFSYKHQDYNSSNLVPIYQSRESFSPLYSHSSDDYYGFFEDEEGDWLETPEGDHSMEIGIGRIPAQSLTDAGIIVDKIIRYSTSPSTLGPWRNELVYVADDGDANEHVIQAESLIDQITAVSPFNPSKLYLDAFDQIGTSGAGESPDLERAIQQSFEQGALFMNFLGHGNYRQWMDEQTLLFSHIDGLRNYQKLPVLVTATCEFGKYDDPFRESGAERLIVSDKGTIALLTTTRPVFAHTNFILNQAFHETIASAMDDATMRLGDIIRITKNNSLEGPVNRNFALLGDPMMRPAYPKYTVEIAQFEVAERDTLSALETLNLSGSVTNQGLLVDTFNGEVEIVLFDVPVEKITQGHENAPFEYSERDNLLFKGAATVSNGEFQAEIMLPRNISYTNDLGKMSIYAWSEELNVDASGSYQNLVIGGTEENYAEDNTAPLLDIYLNEPGFKNGGLIGPGAVLIAEFSDDSGINISNIGFERGITMELNDEIIELNDFYTANKDEFSNGTVVYPLQDLEPGRYTAKIKASDLHNNPVEGAVEFVVSDQPIIQTYNFTTYPNPARTYVNFAFEHDREGEPLVVELIIYSSNGERAWTEKKEIDFSLRNELIEFDWSTRPLREGLYVYKLAIRSSADGALAERTGRMVIRN